MKQNAARDYYSGCHGGGHDAVQVDKYCGHLRQLLEYYYFCSCFWGGYQYTKVREAVYF
jgi:hypothetical protein